MSDDRKDKNAEEDAWDEFMMQQPPVRSSAPVGTPCIPDKFDVLHGQGRMHAAHPGNRRYQALIDRKCDDYARYMARRSSLVAEIIGETKLEGRFLRLNSNGDWELLPPEKEIEKVSQALRYRVRKRGLASAFSAHGKEAVAGTVAARPPSSSDDSNSRPNKHANTQPWSTALSNPVPMSIMSNQPQHQFRGHPSVSFAPSRYMAPPEDQEDRKLPAKSNEYSVFDDTPLSIGKSSPGGSDEERLMQACLDGLGTSEKTPSPPDGSTNNYRDRSLSIDSHDWIVHSSGPKMPSMSDGNKQRGPPFS